MLMKNIQQIKLIHDALLKEKEKYSFELTKVNNSIEKKSYSILRMLSYRKDYFNPNNLKLTHATPALNKNFYSFAKKIDEVLKQAEDDLAKMKAARESIFQKINEINKKIDLMDLFENRLKNEAESKADKLEQLMLDDISTTRHLRGDYD